MLLGSNINPTNKQRNASKGSLNTRNSINGNINDFDYSQSNSNQNLKNDANPYIVDASGYKKGFKKKAESIDVVRFAQCDLISFAYIYSSQENAVDSLKTRITLACKIR